MKLSFSLAFLFTLGHSLVPYKDGIRKSGGSKECPDNYGAIYNERLCWEVVTRGCLIKNNSSECKLWSKPMEMNRFVTNSTRNQHGCYYDEGHGVFFNRGTDFAGKFNENNDRPICVYWPYKDGVVKRGGSDECPSGYEPVLDMVECRNIAQGPCLIKEEREAECKYWSTALNRDTLVTNSTQNQHGCYYDEGHGVLFNKGTFGGKFNEETDRPICKLTPTPAPTVTAGPLTPIIQWLKLLITEGTQEIQKIKEDIEKKKIDVGIVTHIAGAAFGWEAIAARKKDEADRALAAAKGERDTACKDKSDTVPVLEGEIGVFQKVIGLLQKLSNGTELVEKEQEEVKAFISLADQADGKKITQVISLINGLITSANRTIAQLTIACRDAQAKVDTLNYAYEKAISVWVAAVKRSEAAQKRLEETKGVLEAAKKFASRRIPVVQDEIEKLNDALDLINSLQ